MRFSRCDTLATTTPSRCSTARPSRAFASVSWISSSRSSPDSLSFGASARSEDDAEKTPAVPRVSPGGEHGQAGQHRRGEPDQQKENHPCTGRAVAEVALRSAARESPRYASARNGPYAKSLKRAWRVDKPPDHPHHHEAADEITRPDMERKPGVFRLADAEATKNAITSDQ